MNQRGESKTDTLVKLVLVVFISLLAFSVGTYVGKNVSDSQYKQAKLEVEYGGERNTASIPDKNLDVTPENALTDSDIQKLADEFVKEEPKKGEEKAKATEHVVDTKTAKEQTPHKASPVADKVAKGEAPVVKAAANTTDSSVKEENRKPSSLPTAVATSVIGKYTIQVASYPSEKEAGQYAGDLKKKGFEAFFVPADIKGKTWYRVSIGNYSTRAEAAKKLDMIKKQAELNSAIIQKIIE